MIDLLAQLNVVDAWNEISWEDAIPFMLTIIGLYWVKVKIDTSAGLGRKKRNQLKQVIVEAITESGLADKNS
jgi:hypothetical protein